MKLLDAGRPGLARARPMRACTGALLAFTLMLFALLFASAHAQPAEPPADPPAPIVAAPEAGTDDAIRDRLQRIFAQIGTLSRIEVDVADGVVTLSGATPDKAAADQAASIAERIEGVVAVSNLTEASVAVEERFSPFIARTQALTRQALNAAPLFLLSLGVFGVIALIGFWVASWKLWTRVTPNPFVADLLSQALRVIALVFGVVIALNLAGATALLAAILGGAGLVGIAVGLAVRDALENYISSIMLSLRQPFRANDHIVIDGHEGKVMRLTSRATILMTLDGNHLRIPNSQVYKAVILNYTRNPERRFSFELGVDANDDPQAAIATGLSAMTALDFVLAEPKPVGNIKTVGDSNIVLTFTGWINQEQADFLKARSEAIRATKMAVEAAGFTLPEPIYRLRIDQAPPGLAASDQAQPGVTLPGISAGQSHRRSRPAPPDMTAAEEAASVKPDDHLDEKIAAERAETGEKDLLDSGRPTE